MRRVVQCLGGLVLLCGTGLMFYPVLYEDSINHPHKTQVMMAAGFIVMVTGGAGMFFSLPKTDEWLCGQLIAELEKEAQWVHRSRFLGEWKRKYGCKRVERLLNELVAAGQVVQRQMLFPKEAGSAAVLGIAHPQYAGEPANT